ncbi:hypothetical protein L2E82_03085 [Cichorium intybus]|uniref:Uncharacterized protein n=1 Tax=Cichorium intybus TaxID=13427 RepID=A0ACB9H5F9_CICIN|nr:hypothetical protein L2E82_03085 [Cichorium intybus]
MAPTILITIVLHFLLYPQLHQQQPLPATGFSISHRGAYHRQAKYTVATNKYCGGQEVSSEAFPSNPKRGRRGLSQKSELMVLSEGLKYDKVIGQSADLFSLQRFINRSKPRLKNQEQQNLTRWAALFDYTAAELGKFVVDESEKFQLLAGRTSELGFTFTFPVMKLFIDLSIEEM